MQKPSKNFLSILALFTFFYLAIASSPKNMAYTDADSWIPENFDPNTTILLIEYHPLGEKQNDRMIKFLDEHYPYRYEIVDSTMFAATTGKYADTKKYPFVLRWKPQNSSYTTMTYTETLAANKIIKEIGSSQNATWDMYGYFIDRVNNKRFPATKNSNVFGQLGYEPVLNSIKKKFKDKEK